MTTKPIILVSNDDGITHKGLRVLVESIASFAEPIVVAPNKPQSAMGHAITIHYPITINKSHLFGSIEAYECSGTPADCIKVAKKHILKEREALMVVSGVNHGSNTAVSVLYSGTMSAAIEGALEGLPAIGFSLDNHGAEADFSHIVDYIQRITLQVMNNGLPKGVALNVNFPNRQTEPIKGIRIARQANAYWSDSFVERETPAGRPYLWLSGEFINNDHGEDTDEWALQHNYISIVPCMYDLTAHHAMALLNSWTF